jgi:hypothetical protein
MHTLLCHDFLAQQVQEGLSDPARIRIVNLPDHTEGKHLECESGHKFQVSSNGVMWPCDCYSPDSQCG